MSAILCSGVADFVLDYSQIEALLAVDEEGTFEGATRSLRITAFAITQRIKLLEKTLGVTLVEHKPTRPSQASKVLCDHARDVVALERVVLEQHHLDYVEPDADSQVLKIALNEESISAWFGKVLKDQSKRQNAFRFDVTLANCDRSVDLMQASKVAAAISSRKEPVHGFKGKIVERGTAQQIFSTPKEAYTQALLKAAFEVFAEEAATAI